MDFEKDARIGYVKFKRSVASQILPLITNNGGLFFQEEPISVRVLEGNEETLYWDVSAEKERLNPVPVVHPDPVPSKRLRKIQARKAKQLTRQRGKRVPLGISASLRGGVDTVNAFGKRTRSTTAASPSPETNGKESDKRKLAALRASRKKVKVDPLDSLFQFFSVE